MRCWANDDADAIRACVAQRLSALKDDFLHAVLAEHDEGIDMTGAPRKRVIAAVTDFLTNINVRKRGESKEREACCLRNCIQLSLRRVCLDMCDTV